MSSPKCPDGFDWKLAWFQHRDCLPHLRQQNVIYFITFRLGDSLPAAHLVKLRARRDRWLKGNPPPHTKRQAEELKSIWTVPIERMLDAGHGACELKHAACRETLEATMRHEDRGRYFLGDFVIMPNHVHVLVAVPQAPELSGILQAWKSISSRRINKVMGRKGMLWQPEPFDHIVRSEFYWRKFVRYIRMNPGRMGTAMFTVGCGSLKLPE